MNKKHVICLFLMIILLIIITSTANATNNNQTQLEDIQPQEYINNHNNEQININQPTQYQKQTNNNTQNNNNKEKTIKKDQTQEKTKTATKTTLTINSNKNINVTEKIYINGKLTANGKNIPNATIYLNIINLTVTTTTDKDGNYAYDMHVFDDGNMKIIGSYRGSDIYTSATAQTYVNVKKKITYLTLGSTKNIYVGDKVNIYGKLTLNGENLGEAHVKITLENKTYTLKTNQYGNYKTNITISSPGNKTITATYDELYGFTESINITYVNVIKKTTQLTLGSTKNIYVGDKVNIYGKLTVNGKNLPNTNIIITIGGKNYTLKTTKYGNYNTKIIMPTNGNNTITAKYPGTNTYTSSTNKTYVNVNKKTTQLTLGSTKNIYVNDKVCIYGKLTNNGKNLPNAKITINVDGSSYTLTTNKYGNYNTNITIASNGNKTITATYAGNTIYINSNNKTYVNVNKKTSQLTLGSTKKVFVGNKVCIYGKLTANAKNVANAKITINVGGKSYIVVTSQYGNYNLNVTMASDGFKVINATYIGSNVNTYHSNVTKVTVNKKTTLLTLGSTKNIYVGDMVCIYGKLTTNGKNVANGKIIVNVDGETYTLSTTKYGNYNTNVTLYSEGYKSITATYVGTNVYTTSSNDTYVYVNKITTIISLNTIDTKEYSSVLRFSGKFTEINGKPLSDETLTLNINGLYYYTTTDKKGEFALNYQTRNVGNNKLTISYTGNYKYNPTMTSKNFLVTKKPVIINLDMKNYVQYSEYLSIKGYISYSNNDMLENTVTLNINGKKYYTKTEEYGTFRYLYKTNTVGTNNLTVYFAGNNEYNASTISTTFIVTPKDDSNQINRITTIVTISDTIKQSNGNSIYIKGQLYDIKGNMLINAPLTILLDGKKYYTTTDKYGSYNYNYKANANNYHTLTVYYAGNTKYAKTQNQIIFKAHEKENSIEILTPHEIEYYYDGDIKRLYTEFYEDINISDTVHLGSDTIYGRTQYVEGQLIAGVHIQQNGLMVEEAPANTMTKVVYYFKNNNGEIKTVTSYPWYPQDNIISTDLIEGYIPYKAVITYRQKTPAEIREWYQYYEEPPYY